MPAGGGSAPEARSFPEVIRTSPVPVVTGAAVPAPVPASAVNRLRVLEHALAQHAMTLLRNRHTPPARFREVCNQLLVMLVIEAVRGLPTREEPVETSGGLHLGQMLAKPVTFFTLDRHSLGLAHCIADFLPNAQVGAITLDRPSEGQGIEPRLQLNRAPLLDTACAILFEPVIASGTSAGLAVDLLRRTGAKEIILVSFLGSLAGLSRLQSSYPDLQLWTAGVDAELDPKRGPVPGLGNFAERLYG